MADGFPPWVQELQKGVSPETRVYHERFLKLLDTTIRKLDILLNKYGENVFELEHVQQITDMKRMLDQYNFPVALVEVKREDDVIIIT